MILSIDLGTKKIGLAISDEDETFAIKLPVLETININNSVESIVKLVDDRKVNTLLIGYPLDDEIKNSKTVKLVDNFIELIKISRPNVKIVKWNETLTSVSAKKSLKNQGVNVKYIDSEVARMLLEEYLESKQFN